MSKPSKTRIQHKSKENRPVIEVLERYDTSQSCVANEKPFNRPTEKAPEKVPESIPHLQIKRVVDLSDENKNDEGVRKEKKPKKKPNKSVEREKLLERSIEREKEKEKEKKKRELAEKESEVKLPDIKVRPLAVKRRAPRVCPPPKREEEPLRNYLQPAGRPTKCYNRLVSNCNDDYSRRIKQVYESVDQQEVVYSPNLYVREERIRQIVQNAYNSPYNVYQAPVIKPSWWG